MNISKIATIISTELANTATKAVSSPIKTAPIIDGFNGLDALACQKMPAIKKYFPCEVESGVLQKIKAKSKLGDTLQIGEKLFYRNKDELTELNSSKEIFEKLFPEAETMAIRTYVEHFDDFIMQDDLNASLHKINDYINNNCEIPTHKSTHYASDGSIMSTDNMPLCFRNDLFYRGIKSQKEINSIIESIGGEEKLRKYINDAVLQFNSGENIGKNGLQFIIKPEEPIELPPSCNKLRSFTPNRFKSVSWSNDGAIKQIQNRLVEPNTVSLTGLVVAVDETNVPALSIRKYYKDNNIELPKEFDQNEFLIPFVNSEGNEYKNIANSIIIGVNKKKGNKMPSCVVFIKTALTNQ